MQLLKENFYQYHLNIAELSNFEFIRVDLCYLN